MSIESTLYSHLVANTSVKVYPAQLPQQATLPAITYTRISTAVIQHRGSAKPTFSRPRFQIDCWADSYTGASNLRATVRTAMGTLSKVALLQDDRDIVEAAVGRWRASLDYYIWHEE